MMPSLSAICAVQNRTPALEIALRSWLHFDEIDEFVITDWSSDDEIDYLLDWDKRIKIIRVDGQTFFSPEQARNLATDFVTGDLLLQLDADYVLNPYHSFFEQHPFETNAFYCGFESFKQDNTYHRSLTGLLYVDIASFRSINGYNEYLCSWGTEDLDICERLEALGLQKKIVEYESNCVFHIPHSDAERVANFAIKDKKQSNILNKMIAYSGTYQQRAVEWRTLYSCGRYVRASKIL